VSLLFLIADISQGKKTVIIVRQPTLLTLFHLFSASVDNLRLWNVADCGEDAWRKSKSGVQFKIIPGHHGGYISQMR
jgi:hypothetical protein